MRSRALPRFSMDLADERPSPKDTYERVRRTLDDALAELELPLDLSDGDRSAPHAL
jgi:hypothetical protein